MLLKVYMFFKSKVIINCNARNFSLELPSIKARLTLMNFALKGDKNKWHFEAFALKYL